MMGNTRVIIEGSGWCMSLTTCLVGEGTHLLFSPLIHCITFVKSGREMFDTAKAHEGWRRHYHRD